MAELTGTSGAIFIFLCRHFIGAEQKKKTNNNNKKMEFLEKVKIMNYSTTATTPITINNKDISCDNIASLIRCCAASDMFFQPSV